VRGYAVRMTVGEPSAAARAMVQVLRAALRRVPAPVRRRLDDRVFYAVHQLTRVTNDHYPGATPSPGDGGDLTR